MGAASAGRDEEIAVTGHEHFFSPRCVDDDALDGRFDVVEVPGGLVVLDVGYWRVVARCRTWTSARLTALRWCRRYRPRPDSRFTRRGNYPLAFSSRWLVQCRQGRPLT